MWDFASTKHDAITSASPKTDLSTKLFDAIYIGDIPTVENLLQQPINTNGELIRRCGSETVSYVPLHEAAACEDDRMVRLLVGHGADVNYRDAKGATVLHDAALCGNHLAVKFLLDANADVEARDDDGRTPLHEAADHGHMTVAKHLINHHASINCLSEDGMRPLDLALDNQHFDLVQLLLEKDATCKPKRLGYQAAYQFAAWTGYNGLRKLLKTKASVDFANRRAQICEKINASLRKGMSSWPGEESKPHFCEACNEFQLRCPSTWQPWYAEDATNLHGAAFKHMDFQGVKNSAGNGCALCKMILDALPIDSNNQVHLRYLNNSLRGIREPTTQLWPDFLDKIEIICEDKVGHIRIASLPGENDICHVSEFC
jgi:Ankyrin repeats (3 copies)